jgi:hypothetical protein
MFSFLHKRCGALETIWIVLCKECYLETESFCTMNVPELSKLLLLYVRFIVEALLGSKKENE